MALLAGVGLTADLGGFYYVGLILGALLFLRQQYLMREREPAGCFTAFLNNNLFGLTIFIGLLLDYLTGG